MTLTIWVVGTPCSNEYGENIGAVITLTFHSFAVFVLGMEIGQIV